MQNLRSRLLVLPIAILAAACATNEIGPEPSVAEAQGFLGQVVALAQRHDFQALCALGDGNCQRSLDLAGREAVPAAPPTVVGARILPTTQTGDQISIGGVVLELCGRDATGKPYRSEMLVFRDQGSLHAINAVYWGNARIAGGSTTAVSPAPSASC